MLRKIHPDDRKHIRAYIQRALRRKTFRLEIRELMTNDQALDKLGLYAMPVGVEPVDRDGWEYLHKVTIPNDVDCWIDVQVAWKPESHDEPEPMDWFTAIFHDGRLISVKGHGQ